MSDRYSYQTAYDRLHACRRNLNAVRPGEDNSAISGRTLDVIAKAREEAIEAIKVAENAIIVEAHVNGFTVVQG